MVLALLRPALFATTWVAWMTASGEWIDAPLHISVQVHREPRIANENTELFGLRDAECWAHLDRSRACTRAKFYAHIVWECPWWAVYGGVAAETPLADELRGTVSTSMVTSTCRFSMSSEDTAIHEQEDPTHWRRLLAEMEDQSANRWILTAESRCRVADDSLLVRDQVTSLFAELLAQRRQDAYASWSHSASFSGRALLVHSLEIESTSAVGTIRQLLCAASERHRTGDLVVAGARGARSCSSERCVSAARMLLFVFRD